MATQSTPVTQQIGRNMEGSSADLYHSLYHPDLEMAANCLVKDRHGRSIEFRELYRDKKAIIIFVRNFLCYTCKEYVEDLAKIPESFLQKADVKLIVIGQSSYLHIQKFCSITGYPHEIYVDSDRDVYNKLGMKRGESSTSSGGSPHVKSNIITGSINSIWRAMTSPAFDFQGDPAQQGGALIVGPAAELALIQPQPLTVSVTDENPECYTATNGWEMLVLHPQNYMQLGIYGNVRLQKRWASVKGNRVHFLHRDMNRYDHVPISSLLQYAGVQTIPFGNQRLILEV